jgi:phosphatidate cytidylyltransferase
MELVLILVLIWISDSAAYFCGKAIGRRKITPRISPNKTLEGFIAAVVVPVLISPLVGWTLSIEKSCLFLVLAGLVVSIGSIAGDLFESVMKRGSGIKDASNLIPGHGGVLDRVDSFLIAFPAFYVLSSTTLR